MPTSLGATYGEHRERLELSAEDFESLIDHAEGAWHHAPGERLGRAAASTSWKRSGIAAYKIASADCSNLPLIEYIAARASRSSSRRA